MTLQPHDTAPPFALPDQNGTMHALADYKGRWVLLYFYPEDDTPGCTKEACGIRDAWSKFTGIPVLGVSADTVESHAKFAKKHDLPFTLLSDPAKEALNAYGVWAKKKFMGKEYMGILRASFLIDPDGRIAKIYENVTPETHAMDVLADLAELRTR
jgi:thioredoxin-dependent peroxiredoxin